MRFFTGLIFCVVLVATAAARPFMVVVYNVENLFDLDGQAGFEDYQPAKYSKAHALTKLHNIAEVLTRFEGGRGPDVIFFAEIEVDQTPSAKPLDYDAILRSYQGVTIDEMIGPRFSPAIEDLPAEALLAKAMADRGLTGYHVVPAANVKTADSTHPLAQKCVIFTRFPVKAVHSHATLDARAILEVEVDVDGAPLYLFNNHWKSGAGDPGTEIARRANAQTLRTRIDEILKDDPNADIIIGGDFNSQYNQKQRYPKMKTTGINDVLGSQGNELAVRGAQRDLYNLWFELPVGERGSDTFRGEWGTLMQIIVSRGLYDYRGVQYVDNSFGVAKFPGLNADEKGLPVRWSFDGPAGSGFSDHFPVYAKFLTVTDNRPDHYLPLRNASAESGSAKANKIDYGKVDLEKVAIAAEQLPAGTLIRTDAFKGKIFHVAGTTGRTKRLAVVFRGDTFDVWSFDSQLRAKMRAQFKAGEPMKFYGELGQYRGRWQFVVQDASWVK